MIGISVDDVDASRTLARRDGIEFPLLSDADLEVSRRYVGADANELSVPGVVLIAPDGRIVYRRISTDKADRPSTAELLGEIDRAFGAPADAPGLRGGYAPVERLQLGVAIGGGSLRRDGDTGGAAVLGLSALYPLGRHALAGAGVGGALPGGRLEIDAAVALRLPLLDDLATVQLTGRGGFATGDLRGWHAGARLGVSFAATPDWALGLGAGVSVYRIGEREAEVTAATLMFEVIRLVRVR